MRDGILVKLFSVSMGFILLSFSLFSIVVKPVATSSVGPVRNIQVALLVSSETPVMAAKPVRTKTFLAMNTRRMQDKVGAADSSFSGGPAHFEGDNRKADDFVSSAISLLTPFRSDEKKNGTFLSGSISPAALSDSRPVDARPGRESSKNIEKMCRIETLVKDAGEGKSGLTKDSVGTLIADSNGARSQKGSGIVVFRF